MTTNEFLRLTRKEYTDRHGKKRLELRPRIVCKDGYSISIQAGDGYYCEPDNDMASYYYKIELGFPNQVDSLITEYANNPNKLLFTAYSYVPVRIVDQLLEKHGGIAKLENGGKRLW